MVLLDGFGLPFYHFDFFFYQQSIKNLLKYLRK